MINSLQIVYHRDEALKKESFIILTILVAWAYLNIFQLPYFALTLPLTQNWLTDNGLIVFKDIVYHHNPLPLLVLYGMSKLLGNNFFMLQASSFAMLVLFGYGIYLAARQIAKRVGLISFVVFIISFPVLFNNFNIEEMTSSLFALWAFYFFVKFYKTISYKFIFLFGAFLGLSFMGKQPSILLLFPLMVLLFVSNNRALFFKKTLVYLAFGILISILPFIVYFLYNNALYDFYYWSIIFNLTIYPALSKSHVVIGGIIPILWLLLSIFPAVVIIRKKTQGNFKFIVASLIIATIFLFPSLLPSFLTYKALIFYPYPLILWAIVLSEKKNSAVFLSLIVGIMLFIPVLKDFYVDYFPQNIFNRQYILDYGQDELRVVEWLKKNTRGDEKIINIGNHYMLTLAQRLPANKYVYIFPWLVYPYEKSTKEMLNNLSRVVVLDSRIYEDWPLVDREWKIIPAIRSIYEKETNFGTYDIYVRK